MTNKEAQSRADQLRSDNRDPYLKFEVERERDRSLRYVVRSYRHDQPTGKEWSR